MKRSGLRQLQFHKDKRGTSLVEVIVAMAILAVVVAPALKVLVTSARYNAKSRERQNLTTSAESIMESFKAYTVEELLDQFNTSSFSACAMDASGSMSVTPNALAATGIYDFSLNGILNEGKQYDAVIHVEPYALSAAVNTRLATAPAGVVQFEDMNQYTDAILKWNINYDDYMLNYATTDFENNHINDLIDELNNGLDLIRSDYTEVDIELDKIKLEKREVTISLYEDGSGNTVVDYGIKCYYRIKDYPYHSDATDDTIISYFDFPTDGSLYTVDIPMGGGTRDEIYKNPSSEPLNRVFAFYYPNYDMADEIKIESSLPYATTVYLLKQKSPRYSNTELQTKEAGYSPTVSGSGSVALAHNLDKNLSGASTVPTPSISGFSSVAVYTESAVERTTDKIFMYKILLDIYNVGEAGVGTPLVEIEGTKYE